MQDSHCMMNELGETAVRTPLESFVVPEAREVKVMQKHRDRNNPAHGQQHVEPYLPNERAQPCPSMPGMEETVAPQLCCCFLRAWSRASHPLIAYSS